MRLRPHFPRARARRRRASPTPTRWRVSTSDPTGPNPAARNARRARVARRYSGEKRLSRDPDRQHIPREGSPTTLAEACFGNLDAPSGQILGQDDRAALIPVDADITAACPEQRQGAELHSGPRERLQGDEPFALVVHGDLPSFPQHTCTFRHELIE